MSIYMCERRKRRSQKNQKARFYKASSATRNLYMDSPNPVQDADVKPADTMYLNFTELSVKEIKKDRNSAASSFLDPSVDGDSYLEPNDIEVDHVSEEEEEYENAKEEIKDPSDGSQSYEDMMGSTGIRTEEEQIHTEAQEEDADSYENMQAPVYAQANHSTVSLNKAEDLSPTREDSKVAEKLAAILASWNRSPTTQDLTQENGDFYLSYESHRL
ncbi:uncharacterized protein LOC134570996 [Pelobates fuscus]|uniref:uncharacterized protein LOC134570996 n=1 Tax=Pelobates fuscus TaxID=191477 RepID=UPI002FE4825D